MRGSVFLVLVACGGEPAPAAPIALDVPPIPASSAVVDVPPPNSERYLAPPADVPPPPQGSSAPSAAPLGRSNAAFDKGAAASSLGAVRYQQCAVPGGPTGPGHVTVVFDTSGIVSSTTVDSPPFAGSPSGGCIAAAFGTARVPPFSGPPVRVGKSFVLP